MTDAGLPRRDGGQLAVEPVESLPVAASSHDPEALRSTLSAFHTSTQLGRLDGADLPAPGRSDTTDTPTMGGDH